MKNHSDLYAIIFFFAFLFLSSYTMKLQHDGAEKDMKIKKDSVIIGMYIKAHCDTVNKQVARINDSCKVIKASINN